MCFWCLSDPSGLGTMYAERKTIIKLFCLTSAACWWAACCLPLHLSVCLRSLIVGCKPGSLNISLVLFLWPVLPMSACGTTIRSPCARSCDCMFFLTFWTSVSFLVCLFVRFFVFCLTPWWRLLAKLHWCQPSNIKGLIIMFRTRCSFDFIYFFFCSCLWFFNTHFNILFIKLFVFIPSFFFPPPTNSPTSFHLVSSQFGNAETQSISTPSGLPAHTVGVNGFDNLCCLLTQQHLIRTRKQWRFALQWITSSHSSRVQGSASWFSHLSEMQIRCKRPAASELRK